MFASIYFAQTSYGQISVYNTSNFSVSDSLSVSEDLSASFAFSVAVSDATALIDAPLFNPLVFLSVSDSMSLAENAVITAPYQGFGISVFEAVLTSENILFGAGSNPSVSESTAVTEYVEIDGIPNITLSDSVGVGESQNIILRVEPIVSDSTVLTEGLSLSVFSPSDHRITVGDAIRVREVPFAVIATTPVLPTLFNVAWTHNAAADTLQRDYDTINAYDDTVTYDGAVSGQSTLNQKTPTKWNKT